MSPSAPPPPLLLLLLVSACSVSLLHPFQAAMAFDGRLSPEPARPWHWRHPWGSAAQRGAAHRKVIGPHVMDCFVSKRIAIKLDDTAAATTAALETAATAAVVRRSGAGDTPPRQKMIVLPVEGDHAASCLDGSPFAFYIIPGNQKFFHIGIHGGGWCYDEADCAARAQTQLGSSREWNLTSCFHPPAFSCSGLPDGCTMVFLPYWYRSQNSQSEPSLQCAHCHPDFPRCSLMAALHGKCVELIDRLMNNIMCMLDMNGQRRVLLHFLSQGPVADQAESPEYDRAHLPRFGTIAFPCFLCKARVFCAKQSSLPTQARDGRKGT
jgi:hypothetical protein